jgi:RNA polymerase-binding transcription factor DksA
MSADVDIFPLQGTDQRRFPLRGTDQRRLAAEARYLHPSALPHWRALLGCRWQEHHAKVAELGRDGRDAVHAAGEAASADARQAALRRASAMWHQAVAEWRALGEIEAALSRLAAGRFGWCQQCRAPIPFSRLADVPQAQYCPSCDQ